MPAKMPNALLESILDLILVGQGAIAEVALPQIIPYPLCRIEFWAVGKDRDKRRIVLGSHSS